MSMEPKPADRTSRLALPAIAALTAGYLALIGFTPRRLIGTPEYQWPVLHHGAWTRLPWAALIMALGVAGWIALLGQNEESRKTRFARARLYLALFILGAVFQLGPAAVHNMGLIEFPLRVYLPDHTSYFTDAAKITELRPWLRSFPERVPDFATHTRTHPPGAVLIFYAAQKIMDRLPGLSAFYVRMMPRSGEAMTTFALSPAQTAAGGLMALILFAAAAAAAPLTFALGRAITSRHNALFAAALFAASPAFASKTPILDHVLALFILAALWLTITAVRERRLTRVALAGAIIGTGLWIGTAVLAALPLIACFAPAAIYLHRRDDSTPRDRVILAACIIALAAGVALITVFTIGLALGADFPHVYRAITRAGWTFNNEISGRTRAWMWIAFNPYEVLAFAGPPLAALFAAAVLRPPTPPKNGEGYTVLPWTLALAAFLIALDVSGKVCYEASRLAWFVFPLIAAVAAPAAANLAARRPITAPAAILALQAAAALAFRMIF